MNDPGLLPQATSVLAVCAHPDDESFGLGALLDAFHRAGAATAVLCFTAGEDSTLGGLGSAELRTTRQQELAAAARELAVGTVILRDHADGHLDDVPIDALARDVRSVGADVGADVLLVFDEGGITGHPDHCRATAAARRAGAEAGVPVLAWALPDRVARTLEDELGVPFVGRPDEDLAAAVVVDRTAQMRAIACHCTQVTGNPVVDRRLALQGDREHVRWLGPDRPDGGSRAGAATAARP